MVFGLIRDDREYGSDVESDIHKIIYGVITLVNHFSIGVNLLGGDVGADKKRTVCSCLVMTARLSDFGSTGQQVDDVFNLPTIAFGLSSGTAEK